ncbi:hypothetical protein LZ318_01245 [Saccharopolyspora indica]|uniref:hypothetical protein n=1 Tax=Saccharopolyspora indica TaxID=1229659 RepID=UPI0022EAF6F9|nr:hypothetical protein [Saccharopolyspora indica]MDA3649195.1 hypothetical protein [Saccharopolyspora indica]
MPTTSWTVRIRWAPWSRVVRLRMAGDRWPRLSEGPFSVALRLAWFLLLTAVLLGCWLELLVGLVLMPLALLARAAGRGWTLEISARRCRAGVIRVGSLAAARRLRRALREHLGRSSGLDGAEALLAAEHAEFAPIEISPQRWRLVERRLSPYGRRRWLLWRRKLSFQDAMDSLPSGLGDDPISAIIAIPFLLLFVVLFCGAALELAAQLVLFPFVLLLRTCHALRWPVELVRPNEVEPPELIRGMVASVRARRELTAAHALRLPVPSLTSAPREAVAVS